MSQPKLPLDIALGSGIANCSRCGHDHEESLDWRRFQRPVRQERGGGGGEFRYWARCPISGDPLLLWVSDDGLVG